MSKGLHCDPIEKFVDSINVLENGCWQWNKSLASEGYGKFWIRDTQFLAHRFSYWLHIGEIPKELQIDHLCRNRGCVNPEHLEAVSVRLNILRGAGVAAEAYKRIACPKGHPYDGVNSRGNRICKRCIKERGVLCHA